MPVPPAVAEATPPVTEPPRGLAARGGLADRCRWLPRGGLAGRGPATCGERLSDLRSAASLLGEVDGTSLGLLGGASLPGEAGRASLGGVRGNVIGTEVECGTTAGELPFLLEEDSSSSELARARV